LAAEISSPSASAWCSTNTQYTLKDQSRRNCRYLTNGTLGQYVHNYGGHKAFHDVGYKRKEGASCATFKLYSRATFPSGSTNSRFLLKGRYWCSGIYGSEHIVRGPSTSSYRLQGVLTNSDNSRKWVTPSIYVY
jgi:hypothetical protein